jgi:molybdate transport system substrate-binding protein
MKRPLFHVGFSLLFCALAVVGALKPVLAASGSGEKTLIVSAAASLTNAFGEIGNKFELLNPGTKVIFNFGASGALLRQIEQGAPVDVFASADQTTMDQAAQKNLIVTGTRRDFTGNELVLIIPGGSTAGIATLKDLDSKQISKITLGNPATVPAGRYAREVLTREGLWEKLKDRFIFGESVRQVLDYVSRGEVDAGLVFATDALVARDSVRVALKAAQHDPITYPIAVVSSSNNEEPAKRFVDLVLGEEGREVLSKYGFSKP